MNFDNLLLNTNNLIREVFVLHSMVFFRCCHCIFAKRIDFLKKCIETYRYAGVIET